MVLHGRIHILCLQQKLRIKNPFPQKCVIGDGKSLTNLMDLEWQDSYQKNNYYTAFLLKKGGSTTEKQKQAKIFQVVNKGNFKRSLHLIGNVSPHFSQCGGSRCQPSAIMFNSYNWGEEVNKHTYTLGSKSNIVLLSVVEKDRASPSFHWVPPCTITLPTILKEAQNMN